MRPVGAFPTFEGPRTANAVYPNFYVWPPPAGYVPPVDDGCAQAVSECPYPLNGSTPEEMYFANVGVTNDGTPFDLRGATRA